MCFTKKAYLGSMISSKKLVIEPIAEWMRQKFDQKLPKCAIFLYKNTNINTTPLVSLDNTSTLTISDLFVAHSCFQPIEPKNGLKLFFLLSLCSFSAAFAVGEDGHILAFNFDWYVAEVLIMRPKKNVSRMWFTHSEWVPLHCTWYFQIEN